jgi:hypothetical protein
MASVAREPGHREYRQVLRALGAAGVHVVVGGAWAVEHYVALGRATSDLDVMICPGELPCAVAVLADRGGRVIGRDQTQTRVAVGDGEIDFVHHLAQGEYEVGPEWLSHARPARLFGIASLVAAPEEIVWSKLFVAARHRFDGADIVHLLRATGKSFDWTRLERYCAPYPELLLAFLTLFAFCYPSERRLIPRRLWDVLLPAYLAPAEAGAPTVCRGTLLDRHSFEFDLQAKGFEDARHALTRPKGG